MLRLAGGLLLILVAVFGAGMLGTAVIFGDCAGWKGTGTCPRVPFWDWEVFRVAAGGGAILGASLYLARRLWKPGPKPLWLRTAFLALAVGAIAGVVVVALTAV